MKRRLWNMEMDSKQFIMMLRQIADEKNVSYDIVEDALQQAIAAAYRKDYGDREQQVRSTLNQNTGDFRIFVTKEVTEEVENEHLQISPEDARQVDENAGVGDEVEVEVAYEGFGRVAAQTAKQVILQKIREAERDSVFSEYEDKVGSILNGTVQRVEPRVVYIDVGKAQGILPQSEQIPQERYRSTQRLKVYLREVESTPRGPQLILSRASAEFVSLLFEKEVPEMENDAVQIKAIAREAGVRTKLAVGTEVPGVDPVGTFVGGHGTRVQAVMNEIGEEKIDIIPHSDDPSEFITNALSPTKISSIDIEADDERAIVKVPEDELSVAIGRSGQNVRLASKLTGWQVDIMSESGEMRTQEGGEPADEAAAATAEASQNQSNQNGYVSKSQIEESLLQTLEDNEDDGENEDTGTDSEADEDDNPEQATEETEVTEEESQATQDSSPEPTDESAET
ncbi:transcription termination/antitermination protein NusA [Candidatus Saccharibacteria bacterium QS_5_54_17]|nr:MAG: transcription termination/antitermination protein NusA [Candidatus Saccharibacteria bacterium QS_5_54_17]